MNIKNEIQKILNMNIKEENKIKLFKNIKDDIYTLLNNKYDVWYCYMNNNTTMFLFENQTQIDTIQNDLGINIDLLCSIFDIEYSFTDEYIYCDKCNKYIPNEDIIIFDSEAICQKCLQINFEDYLDDMINNPKFAIPKYMDVQENLKKLGFKKMNKTFEMSLHSLHYDNPNDILKNLGNKYDVIFAIDDSNIFEISFLAYIKEKEEEEI